MKANKHDGKLNCQYQWFPKPLRYQIKVHILLFLLLHF